MLPLMVDLLAAWYANRNFPSPLKAMVVVVFFATLGAFIFSALTAAMLGASENEQWALILQGMIWHPVIALLLFGFLRTSSRIKKRKQQ